MERSFLVISSFETKQDPRPAWLFQFDLLSLVWRLAKKLSIQPPSYESQEREISKPQSGQNIPVTPFRLLVTALALIFGTVKAGLSFSGKSSEPVTLEWVLGVVITIWYDVFLGEVMTVSSEGQAYTLRAYTNKVQIRQCHPYLKRTTTKKVRTGATS